MVQKIQTVDAPQIHRHRCGPFRKCARSEDVPHVQFIGNAIDVFLAADFDEHGDSGECRSLQSEVVDIPRATQLQANVRAVENSQV